MSNQPRLRKLGPRELANLHSLILEKQKEKIDLLYRVMSDCVLGIELLIRKGLVTREEITALRETIRSEQAAKDSGERGIDRPNNEGSIQDLNTGVPEAQSNRVADGKKQQESLGPIDDDGVKADGSKV